MILVERGVAGDNMQDIHSPCVAADTPPSIKHWAPPNHGSIFIPSDYRQPALRTTPGDLSDEDAHHKGDIRSRRQCSKTAQHHRGRLPGDRDTPTLTESHRDGLDRDRALTRQHLQSSTMELHLERTASFVPFVSHDKPRRRLRGCIEPPRRTHLQAIQPLEEIRART